jgi:hypothetical protein
LGLVPKESPYSIQYQSLTTLEQYESWCYQEYEY